MDNLTTAPKPRSCSRWVGILLAVILLPVALVAFLWFGMPPRVPTQPVRLVRGADGRLTPAGKPDETRGAWFEAQAGKIQSSDTFSSSSVSSRSSHARFACQRLLIVNRSDNLLMARVGQGLLDRLKLLGYVQQIDYCPAGSRPEEGARAPDLTVTLDLATLTEAVGPLSRSLEAAISVRAGNGPPDCRNSSIDNLSRPLVAFDWNGQLQHHSTTSGLSSSSAKYKLAAEQIAKRIGDTLAKEFQDRRDKEGVALQLPTAFYPPYRKPAALPLAELGNLELVTTWHGLMTHNETLWRLTPARPAADVLGDLRRRLDSAGWTTQSASQDKEPPFLRMSRGAAVLIAYPPASSRTPAPFLHVQYVDRMTQEELRAAIDESLAQNAPVDVLVVFESQWSQEQCGRILKLLASRPARTPQVSLTVANLYHRLKRDDDARAELRRAQALLRTVAEHSDLESQIRSLAKTLGDEKLAGKPIDARVLEGLGFLELKPGVPVPTQEIALEEPVHFFAKLPDGKWKTISLRPIRVVSDKGKPSYQLAHVESGEGMRSWGTGGSTHTCSLDDSHHAEFSLEPIGSGERFRLATQVSGSSKR